MRARPPDRAWSRWCSGAARRRGRRSSRTRPRSRATPRRPRSSCAATGSARSTRSTRCSGRCACCTAAARWPTPGSPRCRARAARRRWSRTPRSAAAVRFAELTRRAARASCARRSASGWRWPTRSTTTPTSGATRTRWRRRSRRWSAAPRTCTCSSPTCRAPTAAPTTTGCWPSTRSPAPARRRTPAGALVAAMAGNLTGERAADLGAPWAGGARAARRRRWRRSRPRRRSAGRGRVRRPRRSPGPRGASAATTVLNEATGKRLLRVHGVPVPAGAVCASAGAAVVAAADVGGPVAVKALGDRPQDRAQRRAARPGRARRRPRGRRRAAGQVPGRAGRAARAGRLVELLVGVESDPVFGPVPQPRRRGAC